MKNYRDEITRLLKDETAPLIVTFIKKDGTQRTLTCTLNSELIPEDKAPLIPSTESRKPNPDVRNVFETDLGEWRSFRWDRVLAVTVRQASDDETTVWSLHRDDLDSHFATHEVRLTGGQVEVGDKSEPIYTL